MRKRTRLQYVKGFKYSHQNNLRKKNPKELFLTQFDLSLNRKMYVRMKKSKNTGKGAKFDPLLMDHINVN